MKNNGEDKTKNRRDDTGRLEIRKAVEEIVASAPVLDIHTHLFPPEFGELNLFGIDNLLTYHYLVAELFRTAAVHPEAYWSMNKRDQADLVWRTLFVEQTPISEASRGVITVLSALGLDPRAKTLDDARRYFSSQVLSRHIDRVLRIARVDSVVMTNDPFDPAEMATWNSGVLPDHRFHAALRMDTLLNNCPAAIQFLSDAGYRVEQDLGGETIAEIRRYLDGSIRLMNPLYMAVSLPDDFRFSAVDVRNRIINEVVFPTAREHGLPFALMIGVRRGVNPVLRGGGDGVGRADVSSVERMCVENPDVRFLVTFLSRENQHELCVAARKFGNLTPFGCWWFLNNPSIIAEITAERLEMLGTTFIPQHSDARVLDQLIYKWRHSRTVIAGCLADSYEKLAEAGREVSRAEIESDVQKLFSGNFRNLVRITPQRK